MQLPALYLGDHTDFVDSLRFADVHDIARPSFEYMMAPVDPWPVASE